MHIKTKGKRLAKNIYAWSNIRIDYINSREMFCEMMLEVNPMGYTIFRLHGVQIKKPNFCSLFTKTSIIVHKNFDHCSQKLRSLWNPSSTNATRWTPLYLVGCHCRLVWSLHNGNIIGVLSLPSFLQQ
jgi:hypothetical protein